MDVQYGIPLLVADLVNNPIPSIASIVYDVMYFPSSKFRTLL